MVFMVHTSDPKIQTATKKLKMHAKFWMKSLAQRSLIFAVIVKIKCTCKPAECML